MCNPSHVGLIKIGCTVHDPLLRAKQLTASTSAPTPFVCAYHRLVNDPFRVESILHRQLVDYRVNDNREFFRLPLHKAISYIEQFDDVSWKADQIDTPFAELFASFPDDGSGRELTADEAAQCRALSERLMWVD